MIKDGRQKMDGLEAKKTLQKNSMKEVQILSVIMPVRKE